MRRGLRFAGISFHAALHEQADGTVAEEPDADVGEVEMILLQRLQLVDRRFLEHLLEDLRRALVGHEHAVVLGNVGTEPEAIADHVGLRYRRQGLRGADEHVATDHHGVETLWGFLHHLLEEGQLQREQVLRQTLAALPAEHGQGGEDFSGRGIGWQSAALTTGMQQDALLGGEPGEEGGGVRGQRGLRRCRSVRGRRGGGCRLVVLEALPEQPGRAGTTAYAVALGVAGAEVFIIRKARDGVEHGFPFVGHAHQVGWQR